MINVSRLKDASGDAAISSLEGGCLRFTSLRGAVINVSRLKNASGEVAILSLEGGCKVYVIARSRD